MPLQLYLGICIYFILAYLLKKSNLIKPQNLRKSSILKIVNQYDTDFNIICASRNGMIPEIKKYIHGLLNNYGNQNKLRFSYICCKTG